MEQTTGTKNERETRAAQKKELKKLRHERRNFAPNERLNVEETEKKAAIETRIRELMDSIVRDKKITILATHDERERLKRRAATSDKTLNGYLLHCGLKTRPPVDADSAGALQALRLELRKVGNNLNQLSHATNAARLGAAQPSGDEITRTAVAVYALIDRISEKL
jgi:uncharacterized membrane protein YccC